MKLSTKTQFGLRILLQIARADEQKQLVQGKEIAQLQAINEPYLEQILISLKNAGLVNTVRGRKGGYQLARPPADIALHELLDVFEGPIDLTETDAPPTAEARAADAVWREAGSILAAFADSLTLAAIIERHLYPGPEYAI